MLKSFISNMTDPFGFTIFDVRDANVRLTNGSWPSRVKRRIVYPCIDQRHGRDVTITIPLLVPPLIGERCRESHVRVRSAQKITLGE